MENNVYQNQMKLEYDMYSKNFPKTDMISEILFVVFLIFCILFVIFCIESLCSNCLKKKEQNG